MLNKLGPLSKPLLAKLFLFVLVSFSALLFLSFERGEEGAFIEIPAVQIVHAEGEAQAEAGVEKGAPLSEKEKILDEFIQSIKGREKEVDLREKELDVKYQNLQSIKSDIEARVEELKTLKADIEKGLERHKEINDANVSKLAKVYESTPPEQAGPLLSNLDVKIAAQLLLRMNNMKAGKIWGHVDPKRAVLISKELAKYDAGFSKKNQ